MERTQTRINPVARTVLIKRPLYQSSLRVSPPSWLWQVDKRETRSNWKDWEENTVPQQYSGASFKRGDWGKTAIDWCSVMA